MRYKRIVDIASHMPCIQDVRAHYPDSIMFLSHSTSPSPTLDIQALLFGKYKLTLEAPLSVSYNQGSSEPVVTMVGSPTLFLIEITQVTKIEGNRSQIEYGAQLTISGHNLDKLITHGFDYSIFVFHLDTNHPVAGAEDDLEGGK